MSDRPITIIRAPHNSQRPYVATSRAAAQDDCLSWEARGALWFILSKPDDWEIRIETFEKESPAKCGRDKVQRMFRELRKAGYLTFEQENIKGVFQPGFYRVHEVPQPDNTVTVNNVNPQPDKAFTVLPQIPQPDLPVTGLSGHKHNKDSIHNRESRNKKEKMDSQQAPDGAATNGASAPIPASLNKSKNPKVQKPSKAKPKKEKTPPPTPPSPRKRKTDLEKWLERAAAQKPMMEALLRQFDKAYDPIMFPDLEQFCSMATLEKYVPAAEDLTRLGCQPGDVAEICQYLHPKYNSKGWTIGLKTISEKYQEWKAWKARQTQPNGGAHPNGNGAGRPKSVPVVQKRTPEEYGEALEAIRALRKQAAS